MIEIRIGSNAFDVARIMRQKPRLINRARKSALASIGYKLKRLIEEQYKSQSGWPKPKRASKHGMPWWARFVRYRVTPRKLFLFPSKSRSGDKKPKFDKDLMAIIKRHEYGAKIRVTSKMRRFLAAIGMPIRKITKYLVLQKRSAYLKVWDEHQNEIPRWFEEKFFDNLRRYESGLGKAEWEATKALPGFVNRMSYIWRQAA